MDIKNRIHLFFLNLFNIPNSNSFEYTDVVDRVNKINNETIKITSIIFKDTCIQLNKKYKL